MNEKVKVVFDNGKIVDIKKGSTVYDIINSLEQDVIALRVNGGVVPADYEINNECYIETVSINSRIGRKIYVKGLEFLYLLAIEELFKDHGKVSFKHSLDKALYTELNIKKTITPDLVADIKKKMKELSKENIPINRISTSRSEAFKYFNEYKEYEKIQNYKYNTSEYVPLYELKDLYCFFYSVMPISTGVINKFDLTFIEPNGIVLSYPHNGIVPKYNPASKVLESFKDYEKKLLKLGVSYACDINNLVVDNKIRDFIQINEMIYDDNLSNIVNKVVKNKKIKAIFISGPSSSGKTTSAKKIALALKAKGISSLQISTDDYFVNRDDSPKDENGKYDFEKVEAIDVELFNKDLKNLIDGNEVLLPTFNFISGVREYDKTPIKLNKNEVIIVEGLHAINEKLNSSISKNNKLKIYISPFTTISIDRHNHVSTTDLRLIRRMVRDYRTRGYSGEETMDRWIDMRKSEEVNVYPYQRCADYIINTSLAYEIGVLKTYVEPLLYSIDSSSNNYEEAVRVLYFLKGFMNIPGEYVPSTSVIREFIGGSYFE